LKQQTGLATTSQQLVHEQNENPLQYVSSVHGKLGWKKDM
jgi:hypothetical protein